MIAKVICITSLDESVMCAHRCIKSAIDYSIEVDIHKAFVPSTYKAYFEKESIPTFDEKWSRTENAMACFASHHSLWKEAATTGKQILILEHDAVFVEHIPKIITEDFDVLNLGKPSFGLFRTPNKTMIGSLFSRRTYLGGAHGYIVTPSGAEKLIKQSKIKSCPADLFITTDFFKILEVWPWPIECNDSFSTVQKKAGCVAKHKYNKDYNLINVE